MLAFRAGKQLLLSDLATSEGRNQPIMVPGFEGETIAFSRDGTTLATYEDGKEGTAITLWDVASLISPGGGQ